MILYKLNFNATFKQPKMTTLTKSILFLLLLLVSFSMKIKEDKDLSDKYSILFIFPHPDDESYGPGAAIDKSIDAGNEVHLLTLSKGGATRMRHELDLSVEEMGNVRYQEMLKMKEVLNFSSMTVHDLPDGGLKELDPREIENIIKDHIVKLNPHILVTYPVHGISTHNEFVS